MRKPIKPMDIVEFIFLAVLVTAGLLAAIQTHGSENPTHWRR